MEYPTSRHDVYHVAFLLRQKLVADLVPIILNEAQYWTRRRVTSDGALVVSEAPEGKRVIRTAPLTAEEHRRVRLVKFSTRSVAQCFDRSVWDRPQSPSCGSSCGGSFSLQHYNDDNEENENEQNGCGNGDDHHHDGSTTTNTATSTANSLKKDGNRKKTDEDAFTWFEAHVGNSGAPDQLYPDTTSRHPDAMRAGAPRAPGQAPWEGPRLIANCNSEEELCRYDAEWRFDAPDSHERRAVRNIGMGDTIDFTAHCSVFGWENYVKEAEIEIFFGYIR